MYPCRSHERQPRSSTMHGRDDQNAATKQSHHQASSKGAYSISAARCGVSVRTCLMATRKRVVRYSGPSRRAPRSRRPPRARMCAVCCTPALPPSATRRLGASRPLPVRVAAWVEEAFITPGRCGPPGGWGGGGQHRPGPRGLAADRAVGESNRAGAARKNPKEMTSARDGRSRPWSGRRSFHLTVWASEY